MTAGYRRALFWSMLAATIIAALAWSFWPRAVPVEMAKVTRGPMRVEVSDEGRTRVREMYQISAPVAGQLLRIETHAGDAVTAGQTVGFLLPSVPSFLDVRTRTQALAAVKSAEAATNLASAELRRAQAEVDFARSDLRRATALAKSDAISKTTLERAQLTYNTANAQLATAEAALRAKRFDLEAAKALLIDPANQGAVQRQRASIPLIAPVSGRILRVLHESEAVVAAGAPIVEVGDPATLEILVDLISEDAVKVRIGAPAAITDWGGDEPLHARVRRVEPSGFTKVSALGVEEQRVNVLLDFTDPPGKWSSIADGFRVIAHIVTWQARDVLRAPISALFRSGSGWSTFVVYSSRAMQRQIRVGHSNDEMAEILSGLTVGDQVIVHPSDRVRSGVRVFDSATGH